MSHHFSDRAELVSAALDHAIEVILDRVRPLAPVAEPLDILAAVLPTDAATVEHWRFALSVRTGALFDDELARFDHAIRSMWLGNLPAQLEGRVQGDPREVALHLVALVDGIALQAVLDPERWPADRQLQHLRAGLAAHLLAEGAAT